MKSKKEEVKMKAIRVLVLVLAVVLGLALLPEIAKLGPAGVFGAVLAELMIFLWVFVPPPSRPHRRRDWGRVSEETARWAEGRKK